MTEHRRQIGLLNAALAALASLLLACGPAPPAPEVEYSGCQIVFFPGPLCSLWPDQPRLKLWVRVDPGAEVEIRADGKRLDATGEKSQGGLRFRLRLPLETSSLTVRMRRPEEPLSAPWSLALIPQTVLKQGTESDSLPPGKRPLSSEVYNATRLARLAIDDDRFFEARQILTRLKLPPGAPADSQWLVAYNLGLLADHLGDYGSALEYLQQATNLAERGSMDSYHLDSGQVLARSLEELGRSREAEDQFSQLNALPFVNSMPSCDRGTFLTNEAWSQLLAREAGEKAPDPTPTLRRALVDFEKCGRSDKQFNTRLNLALAAQQGKRWPEAGQLLTEAEVSSPSFRTTLDQRLWWLDLKARQAIAERDPGGALQLYGQLADRAREARSIEGGFRAAVGRANAQMALHRPAAATVSFQEADRLIDEQIWQIPASEGRDTFVGQRQSAMRQYLQLLLESGQPREAFELVRRDRSRLLRQIQVRDRLAHLTVLQQRRWDESMSTYWRLHAQVDREAAQVDELPGDELKRALASRAEQLAKARKQLDRAMAELGGRASREESPPSPPSPGEVVLAYHPVPQGWAGFAATPEGVRAAVFDLPEDALANPGAPESREILSSRLLGPFRAVLERASRVRVLPFGSLRSVDFHALPFGGEPLFARLPVVYGLDVSTPPSSPPGGPPRALLVADPEGNLPEARQESKSFAQTVRGWGQGWIPKRLEGRDADVGAVREALSSASFFEFAGHGELAGFAGWDSALLLAAGSRLTSRDLLTLPRVPSWVVLATCEGGLSSREAPGEGIGLAQAFLLAGSQAVVATVRPVRDATAREFVAELHRHWKPGMDLARPFQQTQLFCRQHDPGADWESFRLLEP
jgi:tetratricopeptide (TPR) repeat protein